MAMAKMGSWASVLCLLAATASTYGYGEIAREDLQAQAVTELQDIEIWDAQLFHNGRLFVGKTNPGTGNRYAVEIYSPLNLSLEDKVMLGHTISYLHPYGEDAVMAVGKSSMPDWITHFTVITKRNGRFVSKTYDLPGDYQVDQGIAGESGVFLSEPGSRSVIQVHGSEVTPLPPEISAPGPLAIDDETGSLYVIERHGIGFGDENLVRIDLKTGTAERTFSELRNGLTRVVHIPKTPLFAVSETKGNKILIVNAIGNYVAAEIDAPGNPMGLEVFGTCIVAALSESNSVGFYDLALPEPALIDTWSLDGLDDTFSEPRSVSVDPATGKVFLRSIGRTSHKVIAVAQKPGLETVKNTCMRLEQN